MTGKDDREEALAQLIRRIKITIIEELNEIIRERDIKDSSVYRATLIDRRLTYSGTAEHARPSAQQGVEYPSILPFNFPPGLVLKKSKVENNKATLHIKW